MRLRGSHFGGVGGIRTLGPLLTATRFPVVLVMTTSILLHRSAAYGHRGQQNVLYQLFDKSQAPFQKNRKFFVGRRAPPEALAERPPRAAIRRDRGSQEPGAYQKPGRPRWPPGLPAGQQKTQTGQRPAWVGRQFSCCSSISSSSRSFSRAAWVSWADFCRRRARTVS